MKKTESGLRDISPPAQIVNECFGNLGEEQTYDQVFKIISPEDIVAPQGCFSVTILTRDHFIQEVISGGKPKFTPRQPCTGTARKLESIRSVGAQLAAKNPEAGSQRDASISRAGCAG
jgi:hypothetical protein